jgi:uncharacterized membrane protein
MYVSVNPYSNVHQANRMLIRLSLSLSLLSFGPMAGFFFAYSVTVLPGLDDASIAAMQGINRVVRNPVFFTIFFGGAAVPLLASGAAFFQKHKSAAAMIASAGVIYALGVVVLTAQIHVPMNDALALIEAPAAAGVWADYSLNWTLWNHVCGAVCVLCLGLSAEALRRS